MSILSSLKKNATIVLAGAAVSAGAAEVSEQAQLVNEPTPQVMTIQQNEVDLIKKTISDGKIDEAPILQKAAEWSRKPKKDTDWMTSRSNTTDYNNFLAGINESMHSIAAYADKYAELSQAARKNNQTQFEFDGRTFDLNQNAARDFANVYVARDRGEKEVEVAGKTYSTQSQLSLADQQKYYGNVNQEVVSPQNRQTKMLMNAAVNHDPAKKARLYEVASHSGYPEIEPAKDDSLFDHANAEYVPPVVSLDTVGHIHLRGYSSRFVVDEMAHAWRNTNHLTGEIGAGIVDFDLRFLESNDEVKARYADPTKYEGDTHLNVEMKIRDFIEKGDHTIPEMSSRIDAFRKNFGSEWTYTDKGKELVERGYQIAKMRENGASEVEIQKAANAPVKEKKLNPLLARKHGSHNH